MVSKLSAIGCLLLLATLVAPLDWSSPAAGQALPVCNKEGDNFCTQRACKDLGGVGFMSPPLCAGGQGGAASCSNCEREFPREIAAGGSHIRETLQHCLNPLGVPVIRTQCGLEKIGVNPGCPNHCNIEMGFCGENLVTTNCSNPIPPPPPG
jgi:hypothetical protein